MNRIAYFRAIVVLTASASVARAGDPDLLRPLALLDSNEKTALLNDPSLFQQVIQLTHAQQLILRQAREQKWDERPEVQAKLERARDTALVESWLQSIADPPPDYPGADEIKAAYEARKAALATPRQYRLAQIFIACPKGAVPAAEQKARAKLAAVKKRLASPDEDFATIARRESEDATTADKGGEIGWLSDAQIQPDLRPPVMRLLKHEVGEPVRLHDGWHILKCLDRREARTPSLDEARDTIVKQLRAEKTRANTEAHVAELLQKNPLNVDEPALARALQASSNFAK